MITHKTFNILIIVGIILISYCAFVYGEKEGNTLPVKFMAAQYAADFSDDKILMGASHNVFVGKVVEQTGTKERGIGPETQFSVEVIENIKGELDGTVVVNQQGGYMDGVLYVMAEDEDVSVKGEEDSYFLKPGSTYLFATRYNKEENWHTLNSYPTARKLISSESLETEELKELSLNDDRVNDLKEAYKDEILIEADVKNDNALNSYESAQDAKRKQAEPENLGPKPEDKESAPEETVPVEENTDTSSDTEIEVPTTQTEETGGSETDAPSVDSEISPE